MKTPSPQGEGSEAVSDELSAELKVSKMKIRGGTVSVEVAGGFLNRLSVAIEVILIGSFFGRHGESTVYDAIVTVAGIEPKEIS